MSNRDDEQTPKQSGEADTYSIAADPEDHQEAAGSDKRDRKWGKGKKFNQRGDKKTSAMPLPVKAGIGGVVAVGGILILIALFGRGGSGDEDLQRLNNDLANTRADLVSFQERLADVEGYGDRLQYLTDGDENLRAELESLSGLTTRLDDLEQHVDRFTSQVEVRLSAVSERLDTQLKEAEAAVEEAEQEAQLARDEARRQASAQAEAQRVAQRQRQQARPAAPPRPPFSISGVEYRGGRNFLSIASGEVNSLGDVQLLGERESEAGWQLVRIGASSAEFYHQGRSVTVPLP